MIKFFLLLGLIFHSLISTAQIKSGTIHYERKINLQKRNFYGIMIMGDFELPKYNKSFYTLNFNDSLSVFSKNSNFEEEGFGIGTDIECLINLNTKIRKTIFINFIEPAYLVDSLKKITWKITGQKRNIAGYNCRKAIWEKNDTTRIYAWFTEAIEPSIGPDGFSSLPGAILGLASEDGSLVYFATSVEAKEIEVKNLFIEFKNKKAISIQQFKKQNEETEERKNAMKNILKDLLWY
jgi:GLPGLI family protein